MADNADKVGVITHFYSKLGVGIVKLDKELKKGNNISIKGHKTDFKQTVEEMQFDHKDIESGKKGQEVGVKLNEKVREGDEVFLQE
jgi:putative protease